MSLRFTVFGTRAALRPKGFDALCFDIEGHVLSRIAIACAQQRKGERRLNHQQWVGGALQKGKADFWSSDLSRRDLRNIE
jgi:hypothetical protein